MFNISIVLTQAQLKVSSKQNLNEIKRGCVRSRVTRGGGWLSSVNVSSMSMARRGSGLIADAIMSSDNLGASHWSSYSHSYLIILAGTSWFFNQRVSKNALSFQVKLFAFDRTDYVIVAFVTELSGGFLLRALIGADGDCLFD